MHPGSARNTNTLRLVLSTTHCEILLSQKHTMPDVSSENYLLWVAALLAVALLAIPLLLRVTPLQWPQIIF